MLQTLFTNEQIIYNIVFPIFGRFVKLFSCYMFDVVYEQFFNRYNFSMQDLHKMFSFFDHSVTVLNRVYKPYQGDINQNTHSKTLFGNNLLKLKQ